MPPSASSPPSSGDPSVGLYLIGRKEYLDFPEWGLRRVRVKIDTGARTSAMDAADCQIETVQGSMVARLRLTLYPRRPAREVEVCVPVLGTVVVRNPGGAREERPVIEALMRLGPVEKRIRLTVTRRGDMRYRMILGREALAGSFLVDVSKQYLLR